MIYKILILFLSLVNLVSAQSPIPKVLPDKLPGKIILDGQYIPLGMDTSYRGTSTIYIPHGLKSGKKGFDVLIHFHTQSWLVEQEFLKTGKKAVIVVINFPGLSSVYRIPFQTDTILFAQILDQTISVVTTRHPDFNPRIRRLALSSFSAGYAAIREIIKQPDYYRKINEIILMDSLYAGVTDTTSRDLELPDIEPFSSVVKDAVNGNKTFLSTFCCIQPDTYASTPETNRYLIAIANLTKPDMKSVFETYDMDTSSSGLLILKYDKGNFHVRGYTGTQAVSHTSHIYAMKDWFNGLSISLR